MSAPRWLFGACVALALVQLAAPLGMIARHEATLRNGTVYAFRTAPVDPVDAFRGRYVALAIDTRDVPAPAGAGERGGKLYGRLTVDTNGCALVAEATPRPPATGDYISLRVNYRNGSLVNVRYPFDRYYLNEADAPAAERAYREHSRGETRDARVLVRVRNGYAVIEDLEIGGKPIRQVLRETPP